MFQQECFACIKNSSKVLYTNILPWELMPWRSVRPASTSSFERLLLKNHYSNFNQNW